MVQKYSFEKIKDYLYPEHPSLIKDQIWAMILMFNIIGLPTVLVGNPNIIIKAMLIPIIFINICHVVIRINVEKYQLIYTLLQGISCLMLSILCIMAGYRLFIIYHQEHELLYIFVTMTLYVLFLTIYFIYHRNALKEGRYSSKYKRNKSRTNIILSTIIVFSGGGLLIGKILVGQFKDNQNLMTLILAISLVVLGYLISLGSNCIHKYYLMKHYRPELFRS